MSPGAIVIYYLAGSNSVAIADYMAFSAAFGQVTASFAALAEMAGQFAQINPMLDMVAPILERLLKLQRASRLLSR